MYTVTELERLTNLTRKQVYDRLRLLSQLLDGELMTGRNGKKLLSERGFAIFNRLRSLEGEGLTGQSAVNLIAEELGTDKQKVKGTNKQPSFSEGKATGNPGEAHMFSALLEEKDQRIRELKERIDELKAEVIFLRRRVEELTPLALPRPHWRWFSWLLPGAKRGEP